MLLGVVIVAWKYITCTVRNALSKLNDVIEDLIIQLLASV